MNRYINWYLDKTWRNIWWWRIVAIINTIVLIYLVYYVLFEVLPDYERMYDALESLGYLP